MAWFDELKLPGSTITGKFGFVREDGPDEDDNPDVRLAAGTVTFTPTASAVRSDDAWIGIDSVTATIFEGEIVTSEEDLRPVRILSTDADTGVEGWGWRATFNIAGASIKQIVFEAPSTGVHLTGGDLIPITGLPVEVITGARGDSAYEVAVRNGFNGTQTEWLASLQGDVEVDYSGDGLYRINAHEVQALEQSGRLPMRAAGHALQIADAALGDIPDRVAPVQKGDEGGFAIVDQYGQQAAAVTPRGSFMVGDLELLTTDDGGVQFVDPDGFIAGKIDGNGRTHIYDLATGGGSTAVSTLHVFVAAGQSNMSGRGDPIIDEVDTEDPRIMQYGANRRVLETATVPLDMVDAPFGLSPATTFAREYLETQPPHVGVLLIPAARGGTGFTYAESTDSWSWSDGKTTDPTKDLYPMSVVQTLEGVTAATEAGYVVKMRGVLWHQGEANGGGATEWYAGELDALISAYRTDLSSPDLPFVAGQMLPEGMDENPSKYTVDKAHVATPARMLRTGIAPAVPDSGRYDDYAHFSRVGVEAFGPAYLEAYKRSLLNTAGSRPLRPFGIRVERVGDSVTVTWDAPPCRVTGYRVETQTDGSTWQALARDWPMYTAETFTEPSPVMIRVVAEHDTFESSPTTPIGA